MSTKEAATAPAIYQLKITLRGSRPPIWRRIQVRGNTSLAKLHDIIQIVMGWTNSHLHQFQIGEKYYSDPQFDLDFTASERSKSLDRLGLAPQKHFRYEYDFGDGWDHDILAEDSCAGARRSLSTLPEREAGLPARRLRRNLGLLRPSGNHQSPHHPDHKDMLEWLGGDFDPDAFDLDIVNKQLHSVK
jgi:hypothetical protein